MKEKIKKIRLDIFLLENGYASSREKAKSMIMEGLVFVNNQREDKAGTLIKPDQKIEIKSDKLKYVSRGGYKLEKALDVFNINVNDKICLDIGASTGGFTDCFLQNGAKKVYAIDVGTNQLDYKLRINEKVISIEQFNAKNLNIELFNEEINIVSMDVSFISILKIIPKIKNVIQNEAECIFLIKPQFEAGKEIVDKGKGVIKDKNIQKDIIENILKYVKSINFSIKGLDYSPIKGPKGNIEFLLYLSLNNNEENKELEDEEQNLIQKIINNAHKELD
ncbi:MAG: TlyA family RNA methyltransferase [Eubacteriales bacterium]|nr:TlyA family RNA methyltransferase [Eubacteriales bacterium]